MVAMEAIKASYNLNGLECQQILMTAMGLDWHKVVGDWSPTEAGEILAVVEVIKRRCEAEM